MQTLKTEVAVDELAAIAGELANEPQQQPQPPQQEAPPADPAATDPGMMTKEQADDMASSGWNFIFDEVQSAMPFIRFGDETRSKAVARTTPVLLKHQHRLPDWYKKWSDEIHLGVFVGSLVYNCTKAYFLAKAHAEKAKTANATPAPTETTTAAATTASAAG